MIVRDLPYDRTVVKIRTNENMHYTYMEFPWEQLEHDDNCKTFESVSAYARFLAKGKIQDIVCNTDNELLYLFPEDKAINRNDIKEVYIEEYKALAPRD